MPQTKILGSQIADNSVTETILASNSIIRADLNTSVSGKAVIAKVINNNGLSASYTGADAGTGDVTLSLMMASASQLGGVRIGSGISIDGSGVISASASTSATLNQVVYGTGTGITSSAAFKFDNATSNVQIGTGTFSGVSKLEVIGNSYAVNGTYTFLVNDGYSKTAIGYSNLFVTSGSGIGGIWYRPAIGLYLEGNPSDANAYGVFIPSKGGNSGLVVQGKVRIGDQNYNSGRHLEVIGLARFGTGTGTNYGNVFSDQRNDHGFVVHQSGTDNVYAAFGVTDGGSWKFRVNKDGGLSSTFTGLNTFDGSIKIGTGTPLASFNLNVASSTNAVVTITGQGVGTYASSIYIGQSGANFAQISKYSSGYVVAMSGTSVQYADALHLESPNRKVILQGDVVYNFINYTATNTGTRLDSVGYRIGLLSTLHTVNTKLFQAGTMSYHESGTLRTMTIGAAGALTLQVDEASSTTGVIKSANHLLLGGSSLTNHTIYFSNTDTSIVHTATGGHIFNGGVITSNFVGTNTFAGTLSVSGGTSGNWNTAYSKRISSAAVTGSSSKTLTITLADASTVTASWTDSGLTPRVTTVASDLNPVVNVDTTDIYIITALAGNITIATPSGTPSSEQSLQYKIRTNGTTYTLTMGSAFRDFTILVPGTVNSKWLRIAAFYNAEDAIWDIHAVDIQP